MEEKKNSRIAEAKSAFLRQHVDTLVEWYPWCREAFDKAKAENKLILLNIGSATCHTCHRMADETYKDKETAEAINAEYVPILVDRDERPDLDAVYMLVVQALTKRAGLPMTLLLTPSGDPFFAATYLPVKGYQNVPGTSAVFPAFAAAYKDQPETIEATAAQVKTEMQEFIRVQTGEKAGRAMLRKGRDRLELIYDMIYGGFGPAPKFLMPHNAMFLMRYGAITEDREAYDIVKKTMLGQYQGGIFDHLGGGFMHYATDPVWLTPSFEKLAGDNAMMAVAFAQSAKYTEDETSYRVLREILTFLLRDLKAENGAFYHGIDSDVAGEEGGLYGWTEEQVREVLEYEADAFIDYYNINNVGKLANDSTLPNLLYQEIDEKRITFLKKHREALLAKRREREQPLRDEKITATDNGLIIGALSYAFQVAGGETYLAAAKAAADFVLENMVDANGRLTGCWYDAEHTSPAIAMDYSAMIWGLTELHQASWDVRYLEAALRLQETCIRHFWDTEGKGFFLYADDAEPLMLRPKRYYDAELPCENSLGAYNLMRLGYLTGRKEWKEMAGEMLDAFGGEIIQNPTACSFWLYALCDWMSPGNQVYVFGDRSNEEIDLMHRQLRDFVVIEWYSLLIENEAEKKRLEDAIPALKSFDPNFEQGEAFIGRGFVYAKKGIEDADSLSMGLSSYSYEPCL